MNRKKENTNFTTSIFKIMNTSIFKYVTTLALLVLIFSCDQMRDKSKSADYPITPVLFTQVQLHDNFWLPRILKNTEVTIPIAFQQSEETRQDQKLRDRRRVEERKLLLKICF